MTLLLFEGAAGTGKTTRLRAAARQHLEKHPLGPEERVLALTKYPWLPAPDGFQSASVGRWNR